jgi:tetratricopeptide (TPR) repeat protein
MRLRFVLTLLAFGLLVGQGKLVSALDAVWLDDELARQFPAHELERQLLADAADGRLEQFSLLEAALVASDCTDAAELDIYSARLRAIAETADRPCSAAATAQDRAAALHARLHARVLTGEYRSAEYDPRVTFDRGNYNCLTATMLLISLARTCGAQAQALETPGHVAVILTLDGQEFLLETTLKPADSPVHAPTAGPVANRPLNSRRSCVMAPTEPSAGRLSDLDLVARCFYNRGVAELEAGDYPRAWQANRAALQLDAGYGAAFDNLIATLNNWALELARGGDSRRALELLDRGQALRPGHAPWSTNRRWIETLRSDRG